jgi:hypothetical protein
LLGFLAASSVFLTQAIKPASAFPVRLADDSAVVIIDEKRQTIGNNALGLNLEE